MPVSAATVTGVVCEAAFFADRPTSAWRAAYDFVKPPIPTPPSGWCSVSRRTWPGRSGTAASWSPTATPACAGR